MQYSARVRCDEKSVALNKIGPEIGRHTRHIKFTFQSDRQSVVGIERFGIVGGCLPCGSQRRFAWRVLIAAAKTCRVVLPSCDAWGIPNRDTPASLASL